MSTITLEQHFFASAPVGLVEGRGWKSVARSRGLARHEDLEQHCVYYRPEERSDLEPTSWGWYLLEDGRAMLHRMVYSGTDELRRPGNFLAHGLIIAKKDLELLDYDILALMRWVADRAQPRYPRLDGSKGESGFAARHDQLYTQLNWDLAKLTSLPPEERAKLSALPPLSVAIDEVLKVRAELDAGFRDKTWQPLRVALGEASLDTLLLRTYLCAQDQRRPILLYGVGDSKSEDETTLRVAEFLFALLPYHCRRTLTFTTYAGNQDGDRSMPQHWKRQLVMTTRHNPAKLPSSNQASFPFWVIDARTNKHLLPAPSKLAQFYVKALAEGKWDTLKQLRELCSHFDFPAETTGLENAREMQDWSKGLNRKSYELYAQVAPCLRPGYSEFLRLSTRFLHDWKDLDRPDTALFEGLAKGYLHVVATQYPSLAPDERGKVQESIVSGMATLFQLAFQRNAQDALRDLLTTVSSNAGLADLREPVLTRCFQSLEKLLGQNLTMRDIDKFKGLWGSIRACQASSDTGRRFVQQASGQFADLLLNADHTSRASLKGALASFVLPVMEDARFTAPEQLGARLDLLHDIDPGQPEIGGDFLIDLLARKNLSLPQLADIVNKDPAILLGFQAEWRHACKDAQIAGVIGPRLAPVALLQTFCGLPEDVQTVPVLEGLKLALSEGSAQDRRAITEMYAQGTAARLTQMLAPRADKTSFRILSAEAEVHVALIKALFQSLQEAPLPEANKPLTGYLLDLLAFLLMRPMRDRVAASQLGEVMASPVKLLCERARKFAIRKDMFAVVGSRCAKWREKGDPVAVDGTRFDALRLALVKAETEAYEAIWLKTWCEKIAALPAATTDLDTTRVEVSVDLLDENPHLARLGDDATEMQRLVAEDKLTAAGLGRLLLERCLPRGANKPRLMIAQHFDPANDRSACLELLDRHRVLGQVATRLIEGLEQWQSLDGLMALQDLVRLKSPETVLTAVRQPLRRRLHEQLKQWTHVLDRAKKERAKINSKDFELAPSLRISVDFLGTDLPPDDLERYLDSVGTAMRDWPLTKFREKIPEMMPMLESCATALGDTLTTMWSRLLWPLATIANPGQFCAVYVAAGESLFRSPQDLARSLRSAEAMKELRTMHHYDKLLKAGSMDDALYAQFQERPEDSHDLTDNDMGQVLMARVQFASVFYEGRDSPSSSLASVLLSQGSIGGGRILQSWLAFALMGYLLLEGTDANVVRARARRLCHPRFWRVFRKDLIGQVALATFDRLEDMLDKAGVEHSKRIVGSFRRKFGMLGWIYNSTPFWY